MRRGKPGGGEIIPSPLQTPCSAPERWGATTNTQRDQGGGAPKSSHPQDNHCPTDCHTDRVVTIILMPPTWQYTAYHKWLQASCPVLLGKIISCQKLPRASHLPLPTNWAVRGCGPLAHHYCSKGTATSSCDLPAGLCERLEVLRAITAHRHCFRTPVPMLLPKPLWDIAFNATAEAASLLRLQPLISPRQGASTLLPLKLKEASVGDTTDPASMQMLAMHPKDHMGQWLLSLLPQMANSGPQSSTSMLQVRAIFSLGSISILPCNLLNGFIRLIIGGISFSC